MMLDTEGADMGQSPYLGDHSLAERSPSLAICCVCALRAVHARHRCYTCWRYLSRNGYDRSVAMTDRQRERASARTERQAT